MKAIFTAALLVFSATLYAQNVGIGTITPTYKLDIANGSINTDSLYRITGFPVLSIKGSQNLFVGVDAGIANFSGFANVGLGYEAMQNNIAGNGNTAVGINSLYNNQYGIVNTAIGNQALVNNVSDRNVGVGYLAGNAISTGSYNTFLGTQSNSSTGTLVNATAIGARAYVTSNNAMVLGSINGINAATSSTNVGIGLTSPTARLHVDGSMKLEGLNLFEFGAGVAGKEVNAGKIGYNAFGQNALTFIGAGTNATNRAVYFYAEGGSTFTGPINVGGTVQLNGNAGSSGQVLTSQGASDPIWKDAAYGNNTRFATLFTRNSGGPSGDAEMSTLLYNLNPANVSIGATSITINKTGLYHFDISMTSSISYTAPPPVYPQFELWFYFGLPNSLKIMNKKMDAYANTNTSWVGQDKVSVDVYITAGAVLHWWHILGELGGGTVSSSSVNGFVTGYLIND